MPMQRETSFTKVVLPYNPSLKLHRGQYIYAYIYIWPRALGLSKGPQPGGCQGEGGYSPLPGTRLAPWPNLSHQPFLGGNKARGSPKGPLSQERGLPEPEKGPPKPEYADNMICNLSWLLVVGSFSFAHNYLSYSGFIQNRTSNTKVACQYCIALSFLPGGLQITMQSGKILKLLFLRFHQRRTRKWSPLLPFRASIL